MSEADNVRRLIRDGQKAMNPEVQSRLLQRLTGKFEKFLEPYSTTIIMTNNINTSFRWFENRSNTG